jgi:hypothetical protein
MNLKPGEALTIESPLSRPPLEGDCGFPVHRDGFPAPCPGERASQGLVESGWCHSCGLDDNRGPPHPRKIASTEYLGLD